MRKPPTRRRVEVLQAIYDRKPPSQKELADYLGVSKPSIHGMLTALHHDGLVDDSKLGVTELGKNYVDDGLDAVEWVGRHGITIIRYFGRFKVGDHCAAFGGFKPGIGRFEIVSSFAKAREIYRQYVELEDIAGSVS